MGEIADDIINGECCALCGQYFVDPKLDGNGFKQVYEHGYPVACFSCWEPGCSYPKSDVETF